MGHTIPRAVPYNELQPSQRALVDATNLICGQYPTRTWVIIGTLKVDCPTVAKRSVSSDFEKREDTPFNVDAGWSVEYKGNLL
ncbi:hypothetical protein V8E51_002833 [Hyaloscypha variabilis]